MAHMENRIQIKPEWRRMLALVKKIKLPGTQNGMKTQRIRIGALF